MEPRIYGLRAVEQMTGLSTETILDWERRHGVGKPEPGAGGEMLYSRDDVEELIAFARHQGDAGSPSDVVGPTAGGLDEPPQHETKPGGANVLILLAERDPYAAELTEYFLRTEGYAVTTAYSVTDARRQFEEAKPDLAIVELLIDGGEGFSLLEDLAGRRECPVIVLSAIDPGGHPAMQAASVILAKPVQALALVSAVRDLLGTSALVRRGDD